MSADSSTDPPARSSLRALLRHSSVYGLVPLFQHFLALVLVRLYTHALDTEQWGVLQMTDLLILALTQIVGVNLLGGMVRCYFDHTEERDRNAVVTSSILTLGASAWGAVGLALLFRGELTTLLFASGEQTLPTGQLSEYVVLSLLIVPFALTTRAGMEYLEIRRRSGVFAAISMAKTLIEIGLKIALVVGFHQGVRGMLVSVLIGEVLGTTFVTGWVLFHLRPRIDWRVLRPVVAYTLPLVPVGLCQLGLHQVDRLLLLKLSPEGTAMESVGLYGFGYKLAFVVYAAVLGSFMQIWKPWIFAITDPEEQARELVRVGTYALAAIAAVNLPVLLFGREAVLLLAGQPSYHAAARVVPWVASAYVLYAAYGLAQVALFITKRTWPLLWINAAALLANVGLNLWLVPRYGITGAAWATLLTFGFLALAGTGVSAAVLSVPFRLSRAALVLALVLGCAELSRRVDLHFAAASGWALVRGSLLKGTITLGALLLLWRLVVDDSGRAGLGKLVRDKLGRG